MRKLSILFLSVFFGCGQNPDASLALHPASENKYEEQGYNQDRDFDLIPDYEEIGMRSNPFIADLPMTLKENEMQKNLIQNPFIRQTILKQYANCKYNENCKNNISLKNFLYYLPVNTKENKSKIHVIDLAKFNIRGLNAKNVIYNLEHNTARFIISTPTLNKIYYLAHNQNTLQLIREILAQNNLITNQIDLDKLILRESDLSEKTIKNETIYFIDASDKEIFNIINAHSFELQDTVSINLNKFSYAKFELSGILTREIARKIRHANITGKNYNVFDGSQTTCSYTTIEKRHTSQVWQLEDRMLEFFSIKQNNKIYTLAELHKLGLLEYSSIDSAAQIRINFPEDLDTQEEILLVNEARHQVDSAVFYLDEEYIAENIECTNGNLLYIRSPVPISSYTKALFEEYKLTLKF